MDFRSCSAINKNFKLNDDGSVICILSNQQVTDGICRAYIFANLFFYDYCEQEMNKIFKKLDDKKNELIDSANIPPNATEKLYPPLAVAMKELAGSNALDGLVKAELAKIRPHMSLELTPEEEGNLKKLQDATFVTEYDKFKNTVMVIDEEMEAEKELTFTPEFLRLLTPRAKRLLAPTIKLTCLLNGGFAFKKFELSPEYKLKYIWARDRSPFNEEEVKGKIKEIIAKAVEVSE
jgi:hypothetical protein